MRTNFQMTDQNITMVSGDTLSFNVVLKDQSGEAVTVTASTFKIGYDDQYSGGAIVTKTLGDGITQEGDTLTVRLAPADTADYEGFYNYDFDITVGNDRYTLLRGTIQLEKDV